MTPPRNESTTRKPRAPKHGVMWPVPQAPSHKPRVNVRMEWAEGYTCPACGKVVRDLAGGRVSCQRCGHAVRTRLHFVEPTAYGMAA